MAVDGLADRPSIPAAEPLWEVVTTHPGNTPLSSLVLNESGMWVRRTLTGDVFEQVVGRHYRGTEGT
jgi:hypothetical protein